MLKHHTEETKTATAILLVCGSGLTYLSHRWGLSGSPLSILGAVAGPLAVTLGIGNAIHGRAMPPTHITLPARVWGVLGSIAGSVNLWSLGFFQRQGPAGQAAWLLPVTLVVAWLLPRKFYRGHSHEHITELATAPDSLELRAFLDALEQVGDKHCELFDTDVREQMWATIERKYIQLDNAFELPQTLGMLSEAGNSELRAVLTEHLANLAAAAEVHHLDTEAKRHEYLQNIGVRTSRHGYTYDEFIGAP